MCKTSDEHETLRGKLSEVEDTGGVLVLVSECYKMNFKLSDGTRMMGGLCYL